MSLLNRIRLGILLLLMFCAVAVTSYRFLTGCDWLDAVYFFVITVFTVGYGEQSSQPPAVQMLTIGIILFGVSGVGYVAGLIVQSMVEGQIDKALGVRRMNQKIDELTGHTVLCGYGRIGQTVARELTRRGKPYVVVDRDPEVVEAAHHDGKLVVIGDAADEETLLKAHIGRAETIVVALRADADNVFLTLTARNLNPDLRIIARGELASTAKKLRQAGANQVVLPAEIGGHRMAALVTRPNAAEMLAHFTNHENMDVELDELRIADGSPMVGHSIRELGARQKHGLLIIGIRRADGEMIFNPDPDDLLEAEDMLVVMGARDKVTAFQKSQRLGS